MRCFLALTLNPKAKSEVIKYQQKIFFPKKSRLTKPNQLHLTLFFWSNLNEKQKRIVKKILKQTPLKPYLPLNLEVNSLAGFPNNQKARVAVLKVKSQQANKLYSVLKKKLKQKSLIVEQKDFLPHLTLARLKLPQNLNQQPKFTPFTTQAKKLVFFSSTLTSEGPVYKPIATIKLNLLKSKK